MNEGIEDFYRLYISASGFKTKLTRSMATIWCIYNCSKPPRAINTGDLLAGVHQVGGLMKHMIDTSKKVLP
jgi:hypothetical protein